MKHWLPFGSRRGAEVAPSSTARLAASAQDPLWLSRRKAGNLLAALRMLRIQSIQPLQRAQDLQQVPEARMLRMPRRSALRRVQQRQTADRAGRAGGRWITSETEARLADTFRLDASAHAREIATGLVAFTHTARAGRRGGAPALALALALGSGNEVRRRNNGESLHQYQLSQAF